MAVVHQVFAQVKDEEIKNIVVCENYELANQLARMVYGDEALAWECTQYPVSIGDKCINRVFYFKDGITIVPKMNTAEEDALEAHAKADELSEQQAELAVDTDYRLSLIELGLV